MLQDISIWVYEINRCGYYSYRGAEGRPPLFGGVTTTLAALESWVDGKLLGQTATYGANEGDEVAESYLLDIHHGAHGDYLVGIWNRLPGNRHHVSSVGIGDVVGAASAEVTEIDRDRIPGFATYFWVIPAENRVAAIGLKHLSHGLINFGNYLTGFLKFVNPDHVVLGDEGLNNELVINGYRAAPDADVHPVGIRPTFNIKSIPRGGDLDYLRQNVAAISKVMCKTVISTMEPAQRNWLQSMLDVARIAKAPAPNVLDAPIRVEFPITLTLDELNASILEWEEDISDSSENDLGFRLNDGQKKWLRKSHARDNKRLDVEWVDDELINLAALLGQLQVHRAEILALG